MDHDHTDLYTDLKIEQRTINKMNRIIESKKPGNITIKGVKVKIDPQLKTTTVNNIKSSIADEKTGGFLPLIALIPLIAKAVAAAGVFTGGIATAAKVGHDIAKGSGLQMPVEKKDDNHDQPPCKAKIIDAIITLHKAGFTIMRM